MAHVTRRSGRAKPYIARWVDPLGTERSKAFPRRVDAENHLTAVEASKLRGDYVDPMLGRVTYGEFAESILAVKVNQRPSTQARDDCAFRLMILPYFAKRRLNSIESMDIKAWIATLVPSYAPATIHKAYQLFAWVFQEATEMGVISKSPCWKIKPRRDLPRIEQFEMRFLDETEIRALAEAIEPFFRALILTAGYTGMRFGELAGLRVKHLKLLERSISVEEGMTDVRGKQSFGPLKTKASRRTISIPQFLVDVLGEHLAQRPEVAADDLVFVSEKGGPLRASNVRRRSWGKAVEATVGGHCRFHDLRHSHAAILIKAGVHPKVIQKRMGHSSIRTTLDTYGHVYDELDQGVANALESSWNKLGPAKSGSLHQLMPQANSSPIS